MNLDNINAEDYEFSAQELGELLLASVKQIKNNEVGAIRHIDVNNAMEVRHKTGLSQVEFAHVLGVSVRTLQGWEQGRRSPSGAAATLLKIASRYPKVLLELHSAN